MHSITLRNAFLLVVVLSGALSGLGCGSANASSTTNVSAAPGSSVNVQTTNNANGGSPTVSPNTTLQPTFRP